MERVSVSKGELPVVLVAPHGPDDLNTDYLVELVASEMNLFSVINRGWKKGYSVDHLNDRADCNNISHIQEDVVREEFLEPILRNVARIQRTLDERVFIINVHGGGDSVRKYVDDPELDVIVGYGHGPNTYSHTCNQKLKSAFVSFLEDEGFGVYEGKKRYAGRAKNNLNQLFKKWYPNQYVNSLQLEIVHELRSDKQMLNLTSDALIGAIDSLIMFDDTCKISRNSKYI